MNTDFTAAMQRATSCARAQDPLEATRIIQAALAGQTWDTSRENTESPPPGGSGARLRRPLIDADAETVEPLPSRQAPRMQRLRKPLGEVINLLREGRTAAGLDFTQHGLGLPGGGFVAPTVPEGARFETRTFTCAAGSRDYKLYVPAVRSEGWRGLVVMLHGCKQNPDDFAAGTNMNAVAEREGLVIVYPGQNPGANISSCWNWFSPGHQLRDGGEPAIIAGITREVAAEFGIGAGRNFVAGLSAGGAMAAVMGETYPELYAGVGVHSGLPYGSANDVASAFAAMRGGSGLGGSSATEKNRWIVFHGSADTVVHPSNGDRIAAGSGIGAEQAARGAQSRDAGGRPCDVTRVSASDGTARLEHWLIHGAGHAWSGGSPQGSYTDALGPDASAEMVRFFLETSNDGNL